MSLTPRVCPLSGPPDSGDLPAGAWLAAEQAGALPLSGQGKAPRGMASPADICTAVDSASQEAQVTP